MSIRQITLGLCVATFLLMQTLPVIAQETPESLSAEANVPVLTAIIKSDGQVGVDRNIIFDGSESINPTPERELTYRWNFGDKSGQELGSEVVHTYTEPGTYTVTLTITNGVDELSATQEITVYSRLLVLFTDRAGEKSLITGVTEYAQSQGQFMRVLESYDSQSDYFTAQSLIKAFNTNIKEIRAANVIIIWTGGSASLGALSDFTKSVEDLSPTEFSQKTFVYITSNSLNIMQRIAQGAFRTVRPKRIVLTRPAALHMLVDIENPDQILERLSASGIDAKVVDQITGRVGPLNFMSYLVDYMRNKGVPDNTIFLLLILPVIATLISFIRQVIGISTVGIYAPTIITISLIALGVWTGILTFLVILLASGVTRHMIKRFNIMYIPRLAIVLTITTLIIFLLLAVGSVLDIQQLISVPIFPLLILIAMAEKFLNVLIERGTKSSFVLMAETLFVAVICYMLVNEWNVFHSFLLAYPELVLGLIVVNIMIGKWTGLRLTEYFRFRQVLTSAEHAEE